RPNPSYAADPLTPFLSSFHCSAAPRALHSFPTRRSSDLFLPTPAQAVLKLPAAQRGFFTLADGLGRQGYRSRFIYGGESHFDNIDRKSTRLNSSHVKISYAVFCLKKKKTTTRKTIVSKA